MTKELTPREKQEIRSLAKASAEALVATEMSTRARAAEAEIEKKLTG